MKSESYNNEFNKVKVNNSVAEYYLDLYLETFGDNILEVIDFLKYEYEPYVYEPKSLDREELLKWAETDLKVYSLEFMETEDDYENLIDNDYAYRSFIGNTYFPDELGHLQISNKYIDIKK